MIKDILQHADLGILAILALMIFVIVFIAIVIHTCRIPKKEVERCAKLPTHSD